MKISAGILLYRFNKQFRVEFLIVHPSGEYNSNKPWSVPKGHVDENEDPIMTARRELMEECGVVAPGELISMGSTIYRYGNKKLTCFLGEATKDCIPICNSWEIDHAMFCEADQAILNLHEAHREFVYFALNHIFNVKIKGLINSNIESELE